MDPVQALQDLGLEPQVIEETLNYIKDSIDQAKEQAKEQVIERILDELSDKLGIRKEELEPVVHRVSASPVHWSFSVSQPEVTHTKATDTEAVD
ncbi:MAG: tautomerase family protein [Rhodothermaceae bacterium]|nr:tautomerase family protein [Rhodothermaceae bacterium]